MNYNHSEDPYMNKKVLEYKDFSYEDFTSSLEDKNGEINEYHRSCLHRWHRIFIALYECREILKGPTLDVASGSASFYRGIKNNFSRLLPYSITEFEDSILNVDDDKIKCSAFQVEKERAPFENEAFNTLFFCDVLEHLIVDPMWALLEFNRITKMGGHLVISTPNSICFQRVLRMLSGIDPNTESQYKPCAIYQRHNREWSPAEIAGALELTGYKPIWFKTFPELLSSDAKKFMNDLKNLNRLHVDESILGPESILVAEKIENVNLDQDLPKDTRWPSFLYTGYDSYRRRPNTFPIIIGDDYHGGKN